MRKASKGMDGVPRVRRRRPLGGFHPHCGLTVLALTLHPAAAAAGACIAGCGLPHVAPAAALRRRAAGAPRRVALRLRAAAALRCSDAAPAAWTAAPNVSPPRPAPHRRCHHERRAGSGTARDGARPAQAGEQERRSYAEGKGSY